MATIFFFFISQVMTTLINQTRPTLDYYAIDFPKNERTFLEIPVFDRIDPRL